MKTHRLGVVTIAMFLTGGLTLEAVEKFELETRLYVFRSSGFRSIAVAGSSVAESDRAAIIGSEDAAQFDHETLSLAKGRIAWSGEQNPPKGFSLIATPAVSLMPGEPVTLLSTVATQYLEKAPDGSLQVRDIPAKSPDAPRYELTFTIAAVSGAARGLPLKCEVNLVTVVAREPVPGLTLSVGKPVLARYNEKIETFVTPGEWSGFLIRNANGSGYGVLGLMKVAVEGTSRLLNADEFYKFATFYYRHPRPELVSLAIESLGPSGFVPQENVGYGCIGFFAEIFAAHPARVGEWREVIDRQDARTRELFRQALRLSRRNGVMSLNNHSGSDNEILWGAFFASGNPAYVRKIAAELRYLDGGRGWRPGYVSAGFAAAMTLASNHPQHPLVRATLEEMQRDADPVARQWMDHLLTKDRAGIQEELRVFAQSISPSYPGDNRSLGKRASGDFTPGNPADGLGWQR
jgi:hypothetical protein